MAAYEILIADDHPLFRSALQQALTLGLGPVVRLVEADSIAALVTAQQRTQQTEARLAELTGPILPAGRAGSALPENRPRLPVSGRILAGFGERDAAGGRARGLTIAPAPGAPVGAPLAGTVAFARDWRGYGTTIILRHKGGYLSVVAGLADARVREGQSVRQGALLGHAARQDPRVLYELRRSGRAVHPLLAL